MTVRENLAYQRLGVISSCLEDLAEWVGEAQPPPHVIARHLAILKSEIDNVRSLFASAPDFEEL